MCHSENKYGDKQNKNRWCLQNCALKIHLGVTEKHWVLLKLRPRSENIYGNIPKFDKTESFLSSPKWVEDMCKDGKIENAYLRALQFGMDGDSYSNLWKAFEYLGIFTTDK